MEKETPVVEEAAAAPPRRWRRLGQRLLLLCVTLLVCALLLEVGVLVLFGEQPKFPRRVVEADFGLRVNDPGARYHHKSADGRWEFRINSRGLRADREYPYDKPPGTLRVVCVGDSYTAGLEVDREETFAAVLERELNAAGRRAEVLNAGVSGYSNAEECLYLEKELFRYDPDVVVVSFYINDLVDNVRTGLFAWDGEALRQEADRYVPAGELGNFLNQNAVFSFLAEHSNAFIYLKEQLTMLLKRRQTQENVEQLRAAAARAGVEDPKAGGGKGARRREYQRRLCAAILDRIYADCRERGVVLVVQSIPFFDPGTEEMQDLFPYDVFDTERPGLAVLAMQPLLEAERDGDLLYRRRSQFHWTPRSHEVSGRALARVLLEGGLLDH